MPAMRLGTQEREVNLNLSPRKRNDHLERGKHTSQSTVAQRSLCKAAVLIIFFERSSTYD
jgi:hypothetical protein